nr:hypothetical protein GCM10017611_08120 [Rhodococcus wratislaviensis]
MKFRDLTSSLTTTTSKGRGGAYSMITHGRNSALPANLQPVTCLSQRDHVPATTLPHGRDPFDGATPVLAYQGAYYATESTDSDLRLPVLLMRAPALPTEEGGGPGD